FDLRVRDKRADPHRIVFHFNRSQTRKRGDIHQQLGGAQAHIERWNQALAAGEDARARTPEQRQRFDERSRLRVRECGRLHDCFSSSCAILAQLYDLLRSYQRAISSIAIQDAAAQAMSESSAAFQPQRATSIEK